MKVIKKIISALIWIVLIGIIMFSGYQLELKLNEYRKELDIKTETIQETRDGRTVDFEKLESKNEDVRGWIWLPDSNIDYPIVQGKDNDYYLHRDLDGNYLYDGSIFIDSGCKHPFKDTNTVIYGHHMFSGAMFYDLNKFADKKFFDKHGTFIIETPDGSYDLHVIAYCNEPSDSELYNVDIQDDYNYEDDPDLEGLTEEDYEDIDMPKILTKSDFLELIRSKAINMSDEEFDENDKFVTLSTCAYNYDQARHQVIGVIRDAEVNEKTLETTTTKLPFNKWFALQVVVGIVMAGSLLLPLIGRKKQDK